MKRSSSKAGKTTIKS